MQSVRRSRKDSTRSRPTSMVLFETKMFLSLEMKTKTKMGLLRFMMGKLRRHLAWFHRRLRAQGHNNSILETTGPVRIPTSEMRPRTTIKAVLGHIIFDRTIHY